MVWVAERRYTPNNQDHTQGILPNLRTHELEGQVDVFGLFILDPFVQVARHEHAVVLQPSTLRKHRLELGLVQIQTTSFGDSVLVVLEASQSVSMDPIK